MNGELQQWRGDVHTQLEAARVAIRDRSGVGLWSVLEQMRQDGHVAAAESIASELALMLARRAVQDPALLAQLLHLLREYPQDRS